MPVKKTLELDERVIKILKEEFADYGKYLPTLQDKRMYERKIGEYIERTKARLREEGMRDGRGIDDIAAGGNGAN